jgi:cytochrome c oxidase subunit 4
MTTGQVISPDNHGLADAHGQGINYYVIFGLLICLTVITVAVGLKRFDSELVNVCVALLIAFIKASFVARYFMHLKFEGKLIWGIFLVPLGLCVVLMAALIPDVGNGRETAFHDFIGMFMGMGK